jgi:hypothetical protein
VSLHRTRTDWPIVTAALLIALLAATLLAAGPIYSSAVSLAGLHRVLVDAPTPDANLEVTVRIPPASAGETDAAVSTELQRATGIVGSTIIASGESDTFALPGQAAGEVRDLAMLGFRDGLAEHATLVDGSWPATAQPGQPVQVAVNAAIAEPMGVAVGDELALVSRLADELRLEVIVAAIYQVADPADPYWWGDERLLNGIEESANYRTFGPLMTTEQDLVGRAAGRSVRLVWHAFPTIERLTVESVGALRARLDALPPRLAIAVSGASPVLATELGEILAESDRSLLVSRTGILLLMVQLAVLAGYAIILTAALIVDHRRGDTALLRSRGADARQVGWLALAEGLLLAIPAGLAGPWLAAAALRILNVAGPLSGIGLAIEPRVTADAYLAAGVAAVGCAVLLVLPALFAARSFAAEQAGRSRFETRTLGQRMGIDIALLAVTAIGLWQLRLYGAPLTRSVQGTIGLDPLLVAAPAIGLLAGGVVALRVLPLMAQLADAAVARGRDLVGSLGARQLARRPLRYTRAALLLMLAMSMGVFALSYSTTWASSQADQATFQVGADARIAPAHGPAALPAWSLDTAYGALDGIGARMPVERQLVQVSRTAGNGELISLDAAVASEIVRVRSDLVSTTPLPTLMERLVAGRPSPPLIPVSDRPVRLRVSAEVAIDEMGIPGVDENGEPTFEPVDPAVLAGRPLLTATVTIRDARGLLHAFPGEHVPLDPGSQLIEVPLIPPTERARAAVTGAAATLSYPIQVVAVDLVISLPADHLATAGSIGVAEVAASDAPEGEDWRALNLDAGGGWELGWSQAAGQEIAVVPSEQVAARAMQLGTPGPFGALPGVDPNGRGLRVSFTPSTIARLAGAELPIVVNRLFLDRTAAAVGDRIVLPLEGGTRDARIVGVLRSFPSSDPSRPVLIADLPTLGILRFEAAHANQPPEEWWLSGPEAAITAADSGPFAGSAVTSRRAVQDSLSADPLALGIIGALSLGFVVAGLFAVIGLSVSAAVSARQRRTEFALLRALGLSPGQLSGWLWLENASLVVVSLLAGTALGLLIGWVVLPFITVTQAAATPFPPVNVELPLGSILVLEVVSVAALAITLVALAWVLRRSGVGSVLRMGED